MGKPLEVAIVVGTIPAVSYCATQKVPPEIDELALAGGLMGAPVKLVKCQTVDLEVPATLKSFSKASFRPITWKKKDPTASRWVTSTRVL